MPCAGLGGDRECGCKAAHLWRHAPPCNAYLQTRLRRARFTRTWRAATPDKHPPVAGAFTASHGLQHMDTTADRCVRFP